MNLQNFEPGVLSFCEQRIPQILKYQGQKWLFRFGLVVAGARTEALAAKIAPIAQSIGLVDADGNIDLDLVEKTGNAAFEQQPRVDVLNVTFTQEDFRDLMRHLRQG